MKKLSIALLVVLVISCKGNEPSYYVYDLMLKKYHKSVECKNISVYKGASPTNVIEKDEVILTKDNICPFCFNVEDVNQIVGLNAVDKRTKLYNKLISSGKVSEREIGSLEQFITAIKDKSSANRFYDNLIKSGKLSEREIGTSEQMYNSIASDFKDLLFQETNKRAKSLYDGLTKAGYNLGSYESFVENNADSVKAKALYDIASKTYDNMGDFDTFYTKLNGVNFATMYILTVDGKARTVNKDTFDEWGAQKYADAYKGSTIKMTKSGEYYDIPLDDYTRAKNAGLIPYVIYKK